MSAPPSPVTRDETSEAFASTPQTNINTPNHDDEMDLDVRVKHNRPVSGSGSSVEGSRRSSRSRSPSTTAYQLDAVHTTESPASLEEATEKPKRPAASQIRYKLAREFPGHKQTVSMVKFSPDGLKIASCSGDGTVKIWNVETGRHERTFEGHLAGISTIAWSPDSRWIASGGDDKIIRLWDVQTGNPHYVPFVGHSNYVFSLAFSPKGNMLVSGSHDEAVFVWDVRAARRMRVLPAHSDPVRGVDFVHDGTLIVSCSSDGLIRIWDTPTGQCLRTIVHEDHAPVVGVKFSPNGKYVLAWTLDNTIRLWHYISGRCVKTYQGHSNSKFSITGTFGTYGSPESPGAFLVSGSEDGAICIWDVGSKSVLQTIEKAHVGVVYGTDTHPSSRYIVSGGADKIIRLWGLEDSFQEDQAMENVED